MKNNGWQNMALAALLGIVLTGGSMFIRGEMLGEVAAKEVELRLKERDELLSTDIKEIKESLRRLEDRIYDRLEVLGRTP